jgi:enamine deaminase RidA (YjgF/YER057c/UK114 family)
MDGASPERYAELPAEAQIGKQGFPLADEQEESVAVDAWIAHDALDQVLSAVGSTQEHMLRMRIWQRDKRFYPAYERVRIIRQPNPCASSGHSVTGFAGRGARAIGIDGVAIAASETGTAERTAVGGTAQVERPLTYYSVAAQHGPFAFLAGHIPVKQEPGFPSVQSFDDVPPEGRKFATNRSHTDSRDGAIAAQTWFVYNSLRENLEMIGGDLSDVAHCLVGLEDLRDLPMFHRVHRDVFGDRGPALTIVGAGEVGHRRSRLVVEPTVYLDRAGAGRHEWPGQPPLSAPMARRAGNLLFLSGMLGTDAKSAFVNCPQDLPASARACARAVSAWSRRSELPAQCWQAWSNLSSALASTGSSLERLVKLTVFIADPGDWTVFDAIRQEFLTDPLPAIECVAVPNPGPSHSCAIQLDAIAHIG